MLTDGNDQEETFDGVKGSDFEPYIYSLRNGKIKRTDLLTKTVEELGEMYKEFREIGATDALRTIEKFLDRCSLTIGKFPRGHSINELERLSMESDVEWEDFPANAIGDTKASLVKVLKQKPAWFLEEMYKRISDGEERKLYTALVARKNILASHLINHSNLHELQVLAGIDEALFRFWKPKDQDLESLNKPCGDPSRFCFSYTFEDYPSKPFSKRKANSRERKGLKATDANSLRAFDDFLNEQFPDCNFVNPSGLETRIDENDPPAKSA